MTGHVYACESVTHQAISTNSVLMDTNLVAVVITTTADTSAFKYANRIDLRHAVSTNHANLIYTSYHARLLSVGVSFASQV